MKSTEEGKNKIKMTKQNIYILLIGGQKYMFISEILEKPLEKKAGHNYGPGGNKKLIYFIDDMNMPEVDLYGTVQPHTLIRQHIDYGHG